MNRIDLSVDNRKRACSEARTVLAHDEAGVGAAILYELDHCYLGEGLDRLPGDEPVCTQLDNCFSSEAAEICRQCLRQPDVQQGYFAHTRLGEILQFAIGALGRFGEIGDIDTLRSLATTDALGRDAIRAIERLEQRLLPPLASC
jgi:hypothetical protein